MLTFIVEAALPTVTTLLVVFAGIIGIALLPWTDEELEVASDVIQRTERAVRTRVLRLQDAAKPTIRHPRQSATTRLNPHTSGRPSCTTLPFPNGRVAIRRL
jgi:hypothetical protein